MRNNETGEFELVVGNTQLLSGFFIVVLLFAVAFAMGYVVGQNAPRSAKVASDTGSAAAISAQDTRPLPASPVPQPPPRAADQAAQPAGDGQPQPSTQPARDPNAPPAAAPAASSSTVSGPRASGSAASALGSGRLVPGTDLPPGSFWQLMAIRQPEAEAMRQTLKDKGFPAVLSPGPNNLTRVLVGPFSDTQSFGRAKTELENAGFQPPVRYRRD
ncbi:MAG TPA: SPOR domain-containing protein [Candidatus Acidoferrales bacterium]|nr:SPOR domain-containing protein [Candidatus Acidoferrales bacterium]